MKGKIPTQVGDVLILPAKTGSLVAVGPVSTDGQQNLTADHRTVGGRPTAEVEARKLVMPGSHIYFTDDKGEWHEVSRCTGFTNSRGLATRDN
jgi:hypothetical protein